METLTEVELRLDDIEFIYEFIKMTLTRNVDVNKKKCYRSNSGVDRRKAQQSSPAP